MEICGNMGRCLQIVWKYGTLFREIWDVVYKLYKLNQRVTSYLNFRLISIDEKKQCYFEKRSISSLMVFISIMADLICFNRSTLWMFFITFLCFCCDNSTLTDKRRKLFPFISGDKFIDSYARLFNRASQSADRKRFMSGDHAPLIFLSQNNTTSFLSCFIKSQPSKYLDGLIA